MARVDPQPPGRRDLYRFVWDWGDDSPLMEQRTMLVALAEELEAAGRLRMAAVVSSAALFLDEFDKAHNAERS